MGIRNKLVLCLLAVLFPLMAVGMFAAHLLDSQIAERTSTALNTTQRLEAARIEQSLESYASHARSLASGAHVRDFTAGLHYLRNPEANQNTNNDSEPRIIGGHDGFAIVDANAEWPLQQLALSMQRKAGIIGSSVVELRIVDRNGVTLGETMGFSWTPADAKLVDRSMRAVQTYFGDAFVNSDENQRLGMVSPIIATDDEVVGALIMETRLGPLLNMISKHEEGGNSIEAHVAQRTLEGDAQFITALRFDRSAAFNRTALTASNAPVIQALDSLESQVITAVDYRGVESLLAFQTIKHTGWGLVVKVDTAEIYAPANKLRNWLWWATVASVSFVAIIYLFFLVPIGRRLNKAAAAARQITAGNLSSRVVDYSNDEITELVYSINVLARDLEADQKMRSEIEDRLRHQASHDELTGLLNRKHANRVIKQLTADNQLEHSVMFLDLNGFKDVNDLYGHAAGDEVLTQIALRLSTQVQEGNVLARWGGDEFVVIMPNTSEERAKDLASIVHEAFDCPVDSSEGRHKISCSIGLATSGSKKTLAEALIDADALMYEQKKRQQYNRSKIGMASRGLERAIQEDRIEMRFEPIVRSGRPGNYSLVGAQAHVQIRNKEGGYIVPDAYMYELEDSAALKDMDLRAISMALNALRRWNMVGVIRSNFRLTLRLSAYTLNITSFPLLLKNQLQELGINASQLQLELPSDLQGIAKDTVATLQELGVAVALNGVGTEPNLLRHVPTHRPQTISVGKPCHEDNFVLPHLVSACKTLSVDIVARSVENREQLAQLHALGIKQFQGPLFERPVRAVDFVSRWGQMQTPGQAPGQKKKASAFQGLRLAG